MPHPSFFKFRYTYYYMSSQKKIFLSVIVLSLFGIALFIVFFLPSFFADEFSYVYVTFSSDEVDVSTNPADLFVTGVSRWTDVSATFKNASQVECTVDIKSLSLNQSFVLKAEQEYGVILPKSQDISVKFCGVQKNIRVN